MISDYFKQSIYNLTQRSLRSLLTMVGIFIGVALVVALMSLGQGMQNAVIGQFAGLGANTISIQAAGGGFGPPGSYQSVTVGEDDLRIVKRTPGVKEAFGRMIQSGKAIVDDETEFGFYATVGGESGEYDLSLRLPNELKIDKGRLVKARDPSKVMIGNNLATKEVFGRTLRLGDKIEIEDKNFDVVGILKKTGNPQLDNVIWMTLKDAREISGKDSFGLIAVEIDAHANVNVVKASLEKALRKSRDVEFGKEDFVIESSDEIIASLNSIIGAVKWFLIGIAAISVLVGSVGIMNTMYTSVLERTKEIGIMKAIGGTNNNILSLFLIESGMLGILGGLIGLIIGLGLAFLVQFIAKQALGTELIKAHVSVSLLFFSLLGSFLIGSIAGTLPARQASKMKPVEALQHG